MGFLWEPVYNLFLKIQNLQKNCATPGPPIEGLAEIVDKALQMHQCQRCLNKKVGSCLQSVNYKNKIPAEKIE